MRITEEQIQSLHEGLDRIAGAIDTVRSQLRDIEVQDRVAQDERESEESALRDEVKEIIDRLEAVDCDEARSAAESCSDEAATVKSSAQGTASAAEELESYAETVKEKAEEIESARDDAVTSLRDLIKRIDRRRMDRGII